MRCLDSTYFIDLIRNPELIDGITKKIDADPIVYTTTFNVYECMVGVFSIKNGILRQKAYDKLNKAITRTTILPFNPPDALKAAEIGGTLRRKGRTIGADAITAAIVINNGIDTIVTRNPKHFEMIARDFKLTVESY